MVVRTRSQNRASGETPPAKSARILSPSPPSSDHEIGVGNNSEERRWPIKWFFYGLLILLCEFGLKYSSWLNRSYIEGIVNIPNIVKFNIVYVENRHSAFGMLRHVPDWIRHCLIAFSVIGLGFMTWQQTVSSDSSVAARRGVFCFIIGAIGNMVDRLTVGAVVDYIQFQLGDWGNGYTLAWNISDLVINVGFGHILWEIFVEEPKRSKRDENKEKKNQ